MTLTRLVIVDDHPSFRAAASALLASDGFEVIGQATDGHSAIAAAGSAHPDVLLVDVGLPDVDGFSVAAEITSWPEHPVVVLTSSREACDFGSLVESCGALGFVPKSELSGAALRDVLEIVDAL